MTTSSRDIASGVMYLLSSFGAVASLHHRTPDGVAREIRGSVCETKHDYWNISVQAREDLATLRNVWRDHHLAHHIEESLKSDWPSVNRKFETIDGDLLSLPITSIETIEATNGYVYDFSVEGDENFVAGMGGICTHNTDADVDGSHIRTLLLTFFFRHFEEIVKGGHLYVAQPPLYKVKKGKKGQYLKDDTALEAYLFNSGCDAIHLNVPGQEGTLTGDPLRELATTIRRYEKMLGTIMRNYDTRALAAMALVDNEKGWIETIKDQAALEAIVPKVAERFRQAYGKDERFESTLEQDEENSAWRLEFTAYTNGMPETTTVDLDFVESPEFELLIEIASSIRALGAPPYTLVRKNDEIEVHNAEAIVEQILAVAQKGLDIQRYKGLGEMNPDQLWETTMDPEVRTLLQVKIGDFDSADTIFHTLMGDEVEIRRKFIEDNALNVRNLDV